MTDAPRFLGMSVFAPGAPVTVLRDQVNAELDAGTIPCLCLHPADADSLTLPGRIFGCRECVLALTEVADACQAPVCSCCATRAATRMTGWATPANVIVLARVCAICQKAGKAPMSPN